MWLNLQHELLKILPPETKWRFVFITPGGELDVKATPMVGNFLDGAKLYSTDLDFKQETEFIAPGILQGAK